MTGVIVIHQGRLVAQRRVDELRGHVTSLEDYFVTLVESGREPALANLVNTRMTSSQTLDSVPHRSAPAGAATAPARPTATWRVCRALLVAGLLETIRRRDVYVVLVLTALMVTGAYSFTFFGVSGLEIFVKDMAFTAVGLFSTILAVTIAARQVPEELQRRTIYPLLARPVNRWQLLLGKWLSAWATSSLCFLLLCATALVLLLVLQLPVGAILWQYVLL